LRTAAWGALALAAGALWLSPRAGRSPSGSPPEAETPPAARAQARGPGGQDALPGRNLFLFGAAPAPAARPASRPELLAPGEEAAPAESGPRLVGFIEQGAALRAALALSGRVALVAPGEAVEGYTVVRVDADLGVTLLTPEGDELLLPAR